MRLAENNILDQSLIIRRIFIFSWQAILVWIKQIVSNSQNLYLLHLFSPSKEYKHFLCTWKINYLCRSDLSNLKYILSSFSVSSCISPIFTYINRFCRRHHDLDPRLKPTRHYTIWLWSDFERICNSNWYGAYYISMIEHLNINMINKL